MENKYQTADINLSMITLNVNRSSPPIKSQKWSDIFFKAFNCMLSIRHTLN